jgi:hypothetical protein
VLLFALSPLAVSSLRMVFLDNLATPWVLSAFVLAASPKRRLWSYAASGACFAVAILTKETTVTRPARADRRPPAGRRPADARVLRDRLRHDAGPRRFGLPVVRTAEGASCCLAPAT